MLNHVRTLLLNSAQAYPDMPGEEHIPSSFRVRDLPSAIQRARTQLFGFAPDRLQMNLRLFQYLQLLHSSELEEYVLDLDPRITYSLDGDPFISAFRNNVEQITGNATAFYLYGAAQPDDGAGQLIHTWEVEVVSGNQLHIRQLQPRRDDVTANYLITGGISNPLELPGSGLTFRFALPLTGVMWFVDSRVQPRADLGEIAQNVVTGLGVSTITAIFGVAPEEPYKTFYNLWNTHPQMLYRLAGLLLAVAYRTNEAPILDG